MEHLAGDVLMPENQIPLLLLEKILQLLQLTPTDDDDDGSLLRDVEEFLRQSIASSAQLCYRMHKLHSPSASNVSSDSEQQGFITPQLKMAPLQLNDVVQGVQFLAERGLPSAGTVGQILSFVSAIPWGKISSMLKDGEDSSSTSAADEIDIPFVSQMRRILENPNFSSG